MGTEAKQAKLTARQREVLSFIINYISEKGFPPSIREIGAALNISSLRGVTIHLDALERKGWIKRESTSRAIQVLSPIPTRKKGAESIPILGTIAAGVPILAVENIEGYLLIPEEMTRHSNGLFALIIAGDSMVGDAILPDDIVIIRPMKSVENGELAAVLLGEEATVKRVRFEKDKVMLIASNPKYQPIITDHEGCRIIGKLVGLIRNY
ncbi:MAG: transcriptional repressor LexA [Armatimonadota bacterium]